MGIRNFGMMEITGERLERTLRLSMYNAEGEEIWEYEIEAE